MTDALKWMSLPAAAAAAAAAHRRAVSTFEDKPVDLRLQVQASKVAFVTTKRLSQLRDGAGLKLRAERGGDTIQEFLDATRGARLAGDGRVSFGCAVAARFRGASGGGSFFSAGVGGCGGGGGTSSDAGSAQRDVDSGDAGDGDGGDAVMGGVCKKRKELGEKDWCDMMLVYSPALGWVYLHHVTKAAVKIVQEIVA